MTYKLHIKEISQKIFISNMQSLDKSNKHSLTFYWQNQLSELYETAEIYYTETNIFYLPFFSFAERKSIWKFLNTFNNEEEYHNGYDVLKIQLGSIDWKRWILTHE